MGVNLYEVLRLYINNDFFFRFTTHASRFSFVSTSNQFLFFSPLHKIISCPEGMVELLNSDGKTHSNG